MTQSKTPITPTSGQKEAPHVPAAFINNIADEGTKAEAIHWLQKTWNELQQANEKLAALTTCACGRNLSQPTCRVCDNDE